MFKKVDTYNRLNKDKISLKIGVYSELPLICLGLDFQSLSSLQQGQFYSKLILKISNKNEPDFNQRQTLKKILS